MLLQTLKLGFTRKCPQCGSSSMFNGYLTVNDRCRICDLDFQEIRSDDMPAYLTIAIVGHLILPLIYWMNLIYDFSLQISLLLWIPLTIIMTLGLLPCIKGLAMSVIWYTKKE